MAFIKLQLFFSDQDLSNKAIKDLTEDVVSFSEGWSTVQTFKVCIRISQENVFVCLERSEGIWVSVCLAFSLGCAFTWVWMEPGRSSCVLFVFGLGKEMGGDGRWEYCSIKGNSHLQECSTIHSFTQPIFIDLLFHARQRSLYWAQNKINSSTAWGMPLRKETDLWTHREITQWPRNVVRTRAMS